MTKLFLVKKFISKQNRTNECVAVGQIFWLTETSHIDRNRKVGRLSCSRCVGKRDEPLCRIIFVG